MTPEEPKTPTQPVTAFIGNELRTFPTEAELNAALVADQAEQDKQLEAEP